MAEAHLPSAKDRTKMLNGAMAELRQKAYLASINLTVAEVQSNAGVEEFKRDQRETIENARKAVLRLQKMLDELPTDEPEEKA